MSGPEKCYIGRKFWPEYQRSRTLTVTMRMYRPGDEEGMIACIREEYGDSYFKKAFYEPEYLVKASESGAHTFLVAQTKAGEIAGMLVLEESGREEALCDIASLFLRKKYRGYGLAGPFLQYGTEILLSRHYAAACCHPVLFHKITQELLYSMGFRATGFLLNVFDGAEMVHSFKKDRNGKHSLGLQILPIGKRNAGMLYAPPEHRMFIEKIYGKLSMKFQVVQSGRSRRKDMPPVSELFCREDRRQKSLEIRIRHVGADLPAKMAGIHAGYSLKGRQTINVLLNINEPGAVWAYGKLRELHYFFTGLCSMGNAGEYMVLHHSGEVECFWDGYVVSPEFAEILKYVRKQYERRNTYEKKKTQSPP